LSTKLTRKSPLAGFELVDSHALTLTLATGVFRDRLSSWLRDRLAEDGFTTLTGAQLEFLSALDCGTNYASKLARGLQISRQAVHKTVRELERSGWVRTEPDENVGNQRVILFTAEGERMMAAARKHLSKLDKVLLRKFGEKGLRDLSAFLAFDPSARS